jgi:CDP-diacylglycerol--serine O-phosphatidyltransferase
MIGFYNYTVILTYIGMISGFVGISFAAAGELKAALICLVIAGFCDMFDGKIASTMKRTTSEKRFGIQIDSLSDLICFGALPAMIMCSCAAFSRPICIGIGALYLLCALIRLAWFNVDEEERQSQEDGCRTVYMGLPVTTSAILVPMAIGAIKLLHLPMKYVAPAALLVIAIAFITPFHLKKPGWIGKIVMIFVGVAGLVMVLAGVRV